MSQTTSADYSIRILQPLVAWLREQHGPATLAELAAAAQIPTDKLEATNEWISQRQFETFIAAARDVMPDDATFRRAVVHNMAAGYGPIRYLLLAATPGAVYARAVRTYKLVARIGTPRILSTTRTAQHIVVDCDRPISRLNCLLRQAQSCELPTLWKLPPAVLRETRCAALGDSTCEYHIRWFDMRRWYPPALGFALGLAIALVGIRGGLPSHLAGAAMPIAGMLLGLVLEQQRAHRENLAFSAEQNQALRELAEAEADARRELIEIHQRQAEWLKRMEVDAADRADTIQNVLTRIERTQEERDQQLRGFSHDLHSPLAVLRIGVSHLAEIAKDAGGETPTVIEECNDSIRRVSRLLAELMDATRGRTATLQLVPESIDVPALTERLQRRLRAMVYRRDVRTSVFRTRDAPETVVTDPLLLDRITDNVLSNAAKYTERGSIVVELDGSPGFLIIKVLDSGRGIDPERLERVFSAKSMGERLESDSGYGFGLSVVVRLLGEVGGRLEVMSKPGVGTTFWVYLPVTATSLSGSPANDPAPSGEIPNRVVRIRRVKSA